jgi:hypothetical protein
MMGLMGLTPFLIYYVYFVIPLAPAAYIFIKWRANKDGIPPDPQLGVKVVLYYFKTLSYHVMLIALTLVIFGFLKGGYSDEIEVGLGLLIGGGILYILHWLLIKKIINQTYGCPVSRFFTGFNLIVVGLICMVALLATCIIILKGNIPNIKLPASGLVVYGIAWYLQMTFFLRIKK